MQTYLAGGLHSAVGALQTAFVGSRRGIAPCEGSIFILGFWRSGTTLLHELLCKDERFGFATTYACLNPHHFMLTQSAMLARPSPQVRRPQDKMMISLAAPQEDEFALLCLGARSPYEGLLVPSRMAEAFALADPKEMSAEDECRWRATFETFFRGVSLVSGGKPLILKSPAHSYRVPTLRELLPDPRFVLIVRNPYEVLESMVRTLRALTTKYGLDAGPADDAVREIILRERIRFESKLRAGVADLPGRRFAVITFEQLVRSPVSVIESLYRQLELPSFEPVRQQLEAEVAKRRGYVQESGRPAGTWARRIEREWGELFERYGYDRESVTS